MKRLLAGTFVLGIGLMGCGVNKDYVAEQIQASETRTTTQMSGMQDKTDAELSKLRALAAELSSKTEMALNEAKGFENYQVLWKGEINFDFDSYEITPSAEAILMEAGQKLEQNSGSLVEIAGHTDRTGSGKYNLMLGEHRAQATQRFLADRFGISLYRMFIISYGKEKPLAMPDEVSSNSKNRRVNVTIWGELKSQELSTPQMGS